MFSKLISSIEKIFKNDNEQQNCKAHDLKDKREIENDILELKKAKEEDSIKPKLTEKQKLLEINTKLYRPINFKNEPYSNRNIIHRKIKSSNYSDYLFNKNPLKKEKEKMFVIERVYSDSKHYTTEELNKAFDNNTKLENEKLFNTLVLGIDDKM